MKNNGRQILRKWNIFRVFFFILSFCLCAGNLILTPQAANSATASTVRLSKAEGTVNVSDSTGKAAFYHQDMRLANGDHTITGERSYAWFSLDDTKVVKEDAISDVEVRKRGQKLEVLVNSGSLFFNVTEPLKEDESLNIRTSTMVMGVRGTCGVIKGVGEGVTCLQLLTGRLECIVTNPLTGETKSIFLDAGDQAFFYADQAGQPGVTNIVINRLEAGDLDGFVLMELVGNTELLNKIREESGLDLSGYTLDDAGTRLKLDQDAAATKNNKPLTINNRGVNNGIKDPVWEKDPDQQMNTNDDSSDDSGSSGGNPAKSRVIRLRMRVTATEVQNYLSSGDYDQVILERDPNADSGVNTLIVDIDLNVPSGKTLTAEDGVYVSVEPTASLTVNGTADLGANLFNDGMVKVNSSNTLKVKYNVLNSGSFVNTSSGRTTVGGKFIGYEDSALSNEGQFEGTVSGTRMIILNRGTLKGDVTGSFQEMELMGGTLTGNVEAEIENHFVLEGGTVKGTVSLTGNSGIFKLISGAITASSNAPALTILADDLTAVYLDGATVTNDGSGLALQYSGRGEPNYNGTVFRAASNSAVAEPMITRCHVEQKGSYYELVKDTLYTVQIDTNQEQLEKRSFSLQGDTSLSAEAAPGEIVDIDLGTRDGEREHYYWIALDEEGKPFSYDMDPDLNIPSYGDLQLNADETGTISFVMPSHDVTFNLSLEENVMYFFIERDTEPTDLASAISASVPGTLHVFPGVTGNSINYPAGTVLEVGDDSKVVIEKNVVIELEDDAEIRVSGVLTNNGDIKYTMDYGVLTVATNGTMRNTGTLTVSANSNVYIMDQAILNNTDGGTFANSGSIHVEPDGTLQNETGSVMTNESGGVISIATGGQIINGENSTINNEDGATITNDGTFDNEGTVNNAANGIIDGSGVFNNVSGHTLNNYGKFIIRDGGVFKNGDGAGRDGVANNYDGGVVLNSGTMINNDGSIFRNYGSIIEETPDAVSPDLTEDSIPVVRYGEDPGAVSGNIPDGAVGGECGDTLFWYLEELEEEEAEELRHFTEGSTASASDAERAENEAAVSYVLHITGSGEMEDFSLDGGNSTAPWFEELDGAVRAVRIDEGVTKIGKNAFYGIRTLASVYFEGTEAEWQGVKVLSGNEALTKTVLLFGGDDALVLGDPLIADDEEVSWTEPEAKPGAAGASNGDKAKTATSSDAEKEEKDQKKEQGDTERDDRKPDDPETPWTSDPEIPKAGETESSKSGNGKQNGET